MTCTVNWLPVEYSEYIHDDDDDDDDDVKKY